MSTVAGLFENTRDADRAINDLRSLGFNKDAIGVMAQQKTLDAGKREGNDLGTSAGVGATGGTAAGGLAGLLVGVGALAIPGLGPIIAAGTFGSIVASTVVGAGIGAAAGGIAGSLVGMGLSKEEADLYSEGVKRGGILVTVKAEQDQVKQITDLFRRDNAADVNTRRQEWSQGGNNPGDDDMARGQTRRDDAGMGQRRNDVGVGPTRTTMGNEPTGTDAGYRQNDPNTMDDPQTPRNPPR